MPPAGTVTAGHAHAIIGAFPRDSRDSELGFYAGFTGGRFADPL
jgi:hypothetical protein